MIEPYYTDDSVTLWHGDCRDLIPELGLTADLIVADPPYGETSLTWDRWPEGWASDAANASSSMWCFGSMRMFLDHRSTFDSWKLSQDVVWEKHNGSSFVADRFKRVHEHAVHWYRGAWGDVYKTPQREIVTRPRATLIRRSADRTKHMGSVGAMAAADDGTRLVRSVIKVAALQGSAIHPTEKPTGILVPLIEYACPAGGGRARPVRRFRLDRRRCRHERTQSRTHRSRRTLLRGRRAALVARRPHYGGDVTMTMGTRDHARHGTSTEAGKRWQDSAACQGHGELFYGPFKERRAAQRERVAAAKAICAQCPVAATCRSESTQERFGVWGGLTEEERGWERGWSKR